MKRRHLALVASAAALLLAMFALTVSANASVPPDTQTWMNQQGWTQAEQDSYIAHTPSDQWGPYSTSSDWAQESVGVSADGSGRCPVGRLRAALHSHNGTELIWFRQRVRGCIVNGHIRNRSADYAWGTSWRYSGNGWGWAPNWPFSRWSYPVTFRGKSDGGYGFGGIKGWTLYMDDHAKLVRRPKLRQVLYADGHWVKVVKWYCSGGTRPC